MLNRVVAEALEAELEYLQAQRKKLDAKIEALKAVLSPDDELGLFQPTLPISGVNKDKPDGQTGGNGSLIGKGLRETIRAVVSAYPSGVKRRDLPGKVEQTGYRSTGKMSTRSLVFSEIYRMKKQGKLLQRGERITLPS